MKNFERIARYLGGEMNPGERATFEEEIKVDKALREELETQRLEEELLDIAAEQRIRNELEAIQAAGAAVGRQGIKEPGKVIKLLHHFPYLAAAGILLLIVAVFAIVYPGQGLSPVALAGQEYAANPPDFSSVRGAETAGFADPLGKYENWIESGEPGLLRQAADTLALASEYSPGYPRIQFLLGHAYYRLGRFKEAASQFEALARNERAAVLTRQPAGYYQLLSLMKGGGKKADLQSLINKLKADPDHVFHSNIVDIEQKLR